MEAIVLRNISPEIRKGDILVKKGNLYIKKGCEKNVVEHRTGFLKMTVVNSPNFVSDCQVENMEDWFKVLE